MCEKLSSSYHLHRKSFVRETSSGLRMIRQTFTALTILLSAFTASAQSNDPRLETRIDSIAPAILQSTGVPSASVAVVQHGKLVFAKAYGSAQLDPQKP